MLLLRLSGLLLRFAARTLLGLLFHEPPRRDRLGLWFAPLQKIVSPKITRRKPSVSACGAWPIQFCTAGLKSSQSSRPAAWPSAKPEACGQSDGHCRCAVGDDRERRGNPADQYLGHVVEVLWHRPVGHRLKHLERPWPLHLAHPTRSDRRHGRPSVCRRLRPRGRDTS